LRARQYSTYSPKSSAERSTSHTGKSNSPTKIAAAKNTVLPKSSFTLRFQLVKKAAETIPARALLRPTKADERKNYFKQTLEILKETDAARLFENYVRVDSAIEWAQDNSQPVVTYKKYSRSALEYKKLTKEIMEYADR
jgi:cellulose biosynthesis protein BcsQ